MVSRGRSAAVSTFTTPSAARASAVSSSLTRPRGTRAPTSTACTIPGRAWSAEYRAAPVSLTGPSGRGSAMPIVMPSPPATRRARTAARCASSIL